MAFNELKLPPDTLAILYADKLVITPDSRAERPAEKPANALTFLGENKKHITVLIEDKNNMYLSEADLSFLGQILSACKLTLADIAIVNLNTKSTHIDELVGELTPQHLICFGLPSEVKMLPDVADFVPATLNGVNVVTAPKLAVIASDKSQKLALWNALKQLFQL